LPWCVREGELDTSPMENIKPPKVPEPRTEMLTKEQTKALLASCAGKDLISRRDTAIILLLADTGMRRSELANLTTEDLDLRGRVVAVEGKGDASHRKRFRMVPFGARAAQGLEPLPAVTSPASPCRPAVAVAVAAGAVHLRRHRPDARTPGGRPSGSGCMPTCSGTSSPMHG
jgi:site-specific recombinase XerC